MKLPLRPNQKMRDPSRGAFYVKAAQSASKSETRIGEQHHRQRGDGDSGLGQRSHHQWAHALSPQLDEVGAQSDASKGEQERPSAQVGQAIDVRRAEDMGAGQDREQQESKNEFRKLGPYQLG